MVIYLITNIINGKYYVGKTIHTSHLRWIQHNTWARRGKKCHFSNAIRTYGRTAFVVEDIAFAANHEELLALERLWIVSLRSYDPKVGYNTTFGGEGTIDTIETRQKKALSRLGKRHSEETKRLIGLPRIGKARPQWVIDKCSKGMKGRVPWNKGKRNANQRNDGAT